MDDIIVKPDAASRMSFAAFAAFYDRAASHERWELIDGEAIRMPPPTNTHQRIAKNLDTMLTQKLEMVRPEWFSDREVGVRDHDVDIDAPQPDITIGDTATAPDQIWTERFYFVVGVLSDDRRDVLEKKRHFYMAHQHCRGFLFVSQKRIGAELVTRSAKGWTSRDLNGPDAEIDIPDIGVLGRLGQAYRATPLEPK